MKTDYEKAMHIIIAELKKAKNGGSMYYGWQSNIAMAIYDTFPSETENLHELCNEAAKRFLDNLID